MSMNFETDCISATGDDITAMLETERQVTRRTFLQHVDRAELTELADGMSYARHHTQGLTMAGDWHVSYHKGVYREKPCYFLTWSAIEYVFT